MKKTNAAATPPPAATALASEIDPTDLLIRTVAATQTRLIQAAAFLADIDAKLESATVNLGRIRSQREQRLTQLEHAREDAAANRLFGADPKKLVEIDREIEAETNSQALRDATSEHAGLVRLQATKRKEVEQVTAAERSAREDLLRHLELEAAAEMERAAATFLKCAARVEMLAGLRGTHGVKELSETTIVRLPRPAITATALRPLASFRADQEAQRDAFVEQVAKDGVKVTAEEVVALRHGSKRPYTVRDGPIQHNGVTYGLAAKIDLTADQAQPLLASGSIAHGYLEAATA